MNKDQRLRDDMLVLYGALSSIQFPFLFKTMSEAQAYYDLLDNILEQYKSILKRLWDYDDE